MLSPVIMGHVTVHVRHMLGHVMGHVVYPDIIHVLQDYDENGDYVRTWIPELKNVPARRIHEPWLMSRQEQEQYGVIIGQDYPAPPPSRELGRPHGGETI